MLAKLQEFAASRTQSGWRQYFWDQIERGKDYLRANGLRAAILGLVAGIVFVVFFRWVIYLAVLGILAGYFVWFSAKEG